MERSLWLWWGIARLLSVDNAIVVGASTTASICLNSARLIPRGPFSAGHGVSRVRLPSAWSGLACGTKGPRLVPSWTATGMYEVWALVNMKSIRWCESGLRKCRWFSINFLAAWCSYRLWKVNGRMRRPSFNSPRQGTRWTILRRLPLPLVHLFWGQIWFR